MDRDSASRSGQRRPTSPETQPAPTGDVSADEAEKRRERKRFTDRVAQRQHRKRQKLHIEELEAQLRVLKAGGQSEVAQLTARNARLYDELKQLYGLWDEMEGLLQRQRSLRHESALKETWDAQSPRPHPQNVTLAEAIPNEDFMEGLDPDNLRGATHPVDLTSRQPAETEHTPMDILLDLEDKGESDEALGGPVQVSPVTAIAPQADGDPGTPPGNTADFIPQLRPSSGTTAQDPLPVCVDPALYDDLHPADVNCPAANSEGDPAMDWFHLYEQLESGPSSLPPHINTHVSQGTTNLPRVESTGTASLAPLSRHHDAMLELESLHTNSRRSQSDHQSDNSSSLNTQCLPSSFSTIGDFRPHVNGSSRRETSSTPSLHSIENILDLLGVCMNQWIPPPMPVPMVAMQQSRALPLILVPPLPRDKQAHVILERARANISTIGPPTLSDFLFDDPKNTLSVDLKTLLAPVRQSRRTSEFLATYWVLYLLLRWQVIQDESAYHSVPSWLRPTQLQLTVPHPLAADLIPWPEIREELIHMSLSDETGPYDVSLDIIRYMTVDIHTLEHTGLKDHTRLEAAILDLKNWNLSEEFFDRYPQWKGLEARSGRMRHQSRAMEAGVF
ncbi:hypothetical protein BGZ61DRAFT_484282 [Ilyonectria robusta]|uniref:uncharacterized protein n=1 Tax=Ilyonectria robusta TaxID=1079257 RepID=UPI001E8CDF76|nr:uncharacterized protein BGZ61DRAFT_484282 [Ilyonectria robusta]KAH8665570.1 hypothetical protein BGZ61DRAFT_484282 [Ilyonectria robusta]